MCDMGRRVDGMKRAIMRLCDEDSRAEMRFSETTRRKRRVMFSISGLRTVNLTSLAASISALGGTAFLRGSGDEMRVDIYVPEFDALALVTRALAYTTTFSAVCSLALFLTRASPTHF